MPWHQLLSMAILASPFAAYSGAGRLLHRICPDRRVILLPGPLYTAARAIGGTRRTIVIWRAR